VVASVLVFARPAAATFIVFSASGADAAAIQSTVDAFRTAIGGVNNGNATGPLASGRREINWDGGNPALTTPAIAGTPFNGFQMTRGALFTTPGTGFEQSPFNDVNPTYATTFKTFSPSRLFAPLGSTITDTTFFVPGGGGVPAAVGAFGAVFTDVDLANTSSIQLFDLSGASLGTFVIPTADGGLSFVGVLGTAGERIGRVRLVSGNTALGPNDNPANGVDVVALDDFIFAEPQAVPAPPSVVLAGLGVVQLLWYARRRRLAGA
jgi:hypothetical protein